MEREGRREGGKEGWRGREGGRGGGRGCTHTHTPEEVSLLLSLFLCASQQVKLGPVRRVGKVEPPASQQLPHVLHQLHSGPDTERGKGCLCDAKHLNIFHLRGGGREGWKGGGKEGEEGRGEEGRERGEVLSQMLANM